jgi:hypothetical protein
MKSDVPVLEILTIKIRPGMRDLFHEVYIRESLPLQKKWNLNVLFHGQSLQDDDTYVVMRWFESLADHERRTTDFYASDDWRTGPREALLNMIENISTVLVEWTDLTEPADPLIK